MNKVILCGRLTRNPETRYSQGAEQMAITRYTIAVDRRRAVSMDAQKTDFIPCVAFGKSAEFADKYFRKGVKVIITGRIQTGSYTNRDGQKIFTTEVAIEDQEFAESKKADAEYQSTMPNNQMPANANMNQQANASHFPVPQPMQQNASGDGFMNLPDGFEQDLPFT